MKQIINTSEFVDAFRAHNRQDQFSYSGLCALFEYIEQIEEDTGEEMELDVIAICCDYGEYSSAIEAATEQGWEGDPEEEEEGNEEAALDWLTGRTQVIPHAKGIIIQSF